jgi:hypothetical protein
MMPLQRAHNYVHKKYRAMDRHVMGFGKYSFYVMQPLGTCPLGFSKRPLRVRVSEFA